MENLKSCRFCVKSSPRALAGRYQVPQHLELYAARFYMLLPLTHKSISAYATLPNRRFLSLHFVSDLLQKLSGWMTRSFYSKILNYYQSCIATLGAPKKMLISNFMVVDFNG